MKRVECYVQMNLEDVPKLSAGLVAGDAEPLTPATAETAERIGHSEEKINQLVYQLYDLTLDEIKIIEDSINE